MIYDVNKVELDENGNHLITKYEYWRVFKMDWNTISDFNDFKAAKIAEEEILIYKKNYDCLNFDKSVDDFKKLLKKFPAIQKHFKVFY